MVRENLIKVQQKIDEACERSGRDPKEDYADRCEQDKADRDDRGSDRCR